MNYYFIYSAGGGAGDWNGVKRIWRDKMPVALKERVLLKFGDLYFNHASYSSSLIKPTLWSRISNMRDWLSSSVNDPFVEEHTKILLDSGTSKIVNFIATHYSSSPEVIIEEFNTVVKNEGIIEKYAEVIVQSRINHAVSFDIPNPFKIRAQADVAATAIFNRTHHDVLIKHSAAYANKLYHLLNNDQGKIVTIINGLWSTDQIKSYLKLLDYRPDKIAVGGLTRAGKAITKIVQDINTILPFSTLEMIHFLGCGGIDNSRYIKSVYNSNSVSVDNSTPMNRAIDGNTTGSAQSGYFDYLMYKLHRIKPETIPEIIDLQRSYSTPAYSITELEKILTKILLHQSGHSSKETYNARAQLSFHNHDVFRVNAL